MALFNPQPAPGIQQIGFTQTISSPVTQVVFSSGIDNTFDEFQIHYWGVRLDDNQPIYLQTSNDGGATYASAASAYNFNLFSGVASVGGNVVNSGLTGAAQIQISGAIIGAGVGSIAGASGQIRLFRPGSTGGFKSVLFDSVAPTGASGTFDLSVVFGGGQRLAGAIINAVRIYPAAGNMTYGAFALYGVKK